MGEQVLIRCRRMRPRGKDPATFEIVVPPLAIDQPTPTCHTKGQTETSSYQSGTTSAIYDHSGRTSRVSRRVGAYKSGLGVLANPDGDRSSRPSKRSIKMHRQPISYADHKSRAHRRPWMRSRVWVESSTDLAQRTSNQSGGSFSQPQIT